jgi:hypothetical protein
LGFVAWIFRFFFLSPNFGGVAEQLVDVVSITGAWGSGGLCFPMGNQGKSLMFVAVMGVN